MKAENVDSIPVCESRTTRKLVGIVTDRDLALKIVAEDRDAPALNSGCNDSQPYVYYPDDDLQKVFDTMQRKQVRRVPVVDDNGQLTGIIAQADVTTRCEEPEKAGETIEKISQPVPARAA
jgi:CBS domain-containing protein